MAQGAESAAAGIDAQTPPHGQPAATLPAVEVTANRLKRSASPKYTQPIRDTPQTIIDIPSSIYLEQGASTLSDVLRNTPGITFAAGEGGNANATAGDSFYLRGYDTSNNIFVDGVRDIGAYSRDIFNVDSVEVVKGPAGSDVGRGSPAGFVNLVTKQPRLEEFSSATVSYGVDEATSGSRRRVTVDLNQTLPNAAAGAAIRFNAVADDSDAVGRSHAAMKVFGVAPSLALGLGTPTRGFVSYQHTVTESTPDYGLPSPAFPGYVTNPPAPGIDAKTFYGFTSDFDRVVNDALLARIELDLDANVSVKNQTRISYVARDAVVTSPGMNPASYDAASALLTRSRQGNRRDTEIISNLSTITAKLSTGPIEHNINTGAEIARERAYQPAFVSALLEPIPVAQPDPNSSPSGAPARSGASADAEVRTAAVWLFDTLKLNPRWLVNGGLRIDHYEVDYVGIDTAQVTTRLRAEDTLVSWKSGMVFKPTAAGSIYAACGIAYRPAGTDYTLSSLANNQNNPDTAPQKTTNVELGLKWDFLNHQLQASGAIFHSRNTNTVFTDALLGPIPAGRQTVDGVELSLTGHLTKDWVIFAGISRLDAVYDVGTAAQTGAALPLTPDYSGNLWTTYRFPNGVTLGGGAQYMGEASRLDTATLVPRIMPSYWLVGAVVAFEITRNVTLRLNVNNVLDEDYVRSFNNNGGRFAPGSPRSYLLSAELRF